MTWFKVDDSFYDHPKVAELPDSAVAMWIRAGAYCARHLTDGAVSGRTARRLCDNPDEAIDALLKSGLWVTDGDGGYRFHDWHVYQPTAAEARAARNARSVGGQVGNHERWHVRGGQVDPRCPHCVPAASTNGSRGRSPDRSADRLPDTGGDQSPDRSTNRPHHRSGGSLSESHANPPSRPVPSPKSQNPVVVQTVASVTKQDQEKVEETPAPATRKVWCPEHAQPNDMDCTYCKVDHGDKAYHGKIRTAKS